VANTAAKLGWRVVGGASSAVSGSLARRAANSAYTGVRKTDPPANPANPQTTWAEAIIWAALSGAVIGLVRLAVQRAVAHGWVRATGSLPPGMEDIG
jgi:hypothetical protein